MPRRTGRTPPPRPRNPAHDRLCDRRGGEDQRSTLQNGRQSPVVGGHISPDHLDLDIVGCERTPQHRAWHAGPTCLCRGSRRPRGQGPGHRPRWPPGEAARIIFVGVERSCGVVDDTVFDRHRTPDRAVDPDRPAARVLRAGSRRFQIPACHADIVSFGGRNPRKSCDENALSSRYQELQRSRRL